MSSFMATVLKSQDDISDMRQKFDIEYSVTRDGVAHQQISLPPYLSVHAASVCHDTLKFSLLFPVPRNNVTTALDYPDAGRSVFHVKWKPRQANNAARQQSITEAKLVSDRAGIIRPAESQLSAPIQDGGLR